MNLADAAPRLSHPTYIAPTAHVAGDVSIAAGASVWPGAVVRGDASAVAIGARSAIRERAVVAVVRHGVPSRTGGGGGDESRAAAVATVIGSDVSVGCGATVHAATLKDGAVVGAGAVVGGGAVVGERSVIGAGTWGGEGGMRSSIGLGGQWGTGPRRTLWHARRHDAQQLTVAMGVDCCFWLPMGLLHAPRRVSGG